MTIIAYYQPTTRAYVDQIRGVDSSYTVGLLLDRGLIEECGRLQVPGRPRQYRTTKQFLRAFHLSSLKDLPELPDDTFYVRDLIGCEVRDEKNGSVIGKIQDVLQGAAQDVYVITLLSGKETMIPAVAEFVKKVDMAQRIVTVALIPGFIDDEAVRTE